MGVGPDMTTRVGIVAPEYDNFYIVTDIPPTPQSELARLATDSDWEEPFREFLLSFGSKLVVACRPHVAL